jgi:hypothetical protein
MTNKRQLNFCFLATPNRHMIQNPRKQKFLHNATAEANFPPKNDRPSNTTIPPRLLQHIDIKTEGTQKRLIYWTKPDILLGSATPASVQGAGALGLCHNFVKG